MDFVVHINDGSMEVQPIVLRLLPGEETSFNLRVINHGEPSNVSLEASDPLMRAVRLKRPDAYVANEESIPIMARMPLRAKRLDGELLLTSSAGSSSVPISLIRESEDNGNGSFSADVDEENEEDEDIEEGDIEDGGIENDGIENDGIEDGDIEDGGIEANSFPDSDSAERIKFSRHKDLQRYRAASRSRSRAGLEGPEGSDISGSADGYGGSGSRVQEFDSNYDRTEEQGDELGNERGYGQGHEQGYEQRSEQRIEQSPDQISHISAEDEGPEADFDEVSSKSLGDRLLSFDWERESMQIIPAIIFISIIIALVLTFYTESIPLYAGALASSMLIVTLIIYGAATLLKA